MAAIQEALAEQEEEEREQAYALKRLEETGIKKSNPYYDKLLQVHVDEYRKMKAGPSPPRRSPTPDPFKAIVFDPPQNRTDQKGKESKTPNESTETSQATPPIEWLPSPTHLSGEESRSLGNVSEDSFHAEAHSDASVVGFVKASLKPNGKVITPSKAALEMAEKTLQKWSEEEEQEALGISTSDPVLETPCPANRTKVINGADANVGRSMRVLRLASSFNPPYKHTQVQLERPQTPQLAKRPGAFKSPLLAGNAARTGYARAGPSNLLASTPLNASQVHRNTGFATPIRPGASKTPATSSSISALKRNHVGRPKFESPFKPGMKPGDPTRQTLLAQAKAKLEKFRESSDADMPDDSSTSIRGKTAKAGTYTLVALFHAKASQ